MGTQHKDIIEINGKKYDALTGRLVTESEASKQVTAPAKSPINRNNGVAIDGFVKKSRTRHEVHHQPKTLQKSQTLMRSAVKKPQPSQKKPTNNNAIVAGISKNHLGLSEHRLKMASSTHKSPQISRFGDTTQRTSVIKTTAVMPVKQPLDHHEKQVVEPIHTTQSATVHTASHTQSSSRSKATSAHLEKALSSANAHEHPKHSTKHKNGRRKLAHKLGISTKAMAISTSVLAGVLLGGFFAVQNVPNLSMRVAAARAGFDASMPGYSPSGFSYKGPINYSPGQVTISFKSNTDDREYNVTERATSWNSDALLANYVATGNGQYQTYQDRGRTLYIYNGSNATWVDNGIWYQIEGESDMTTDQLVRIAASI